MPLYEYHCEKCDHTFDVRHAVGELGQKCPLCKKKANRVFCAPGLIFKGSGFHVTDYCNGKSSNNGSGRKSAPACEKKADGACTNPGCAAE